MYGLTVREEKLLRSLSTPQKIQDYLDRLPINWEKNGDTHFSPRRVLQKKKAHCVEGALLAAAALFLRGQKPQLLDLAAARHDDDHVIALFKQNGYWGAISKTNHAVLRFRDPIYKTIRELALSYFHEYYASKNGEKTLISYSEPVDLRTLGTRWLTQDEHLWEIDDLLDSAKHYPLVPKKNKKMIRYATAFERKTTDAREWKRSDART